MFFKICNLTRIFDFLGSAGLIRCLAAEPDENTISVGHSSGFISQLGNEKLKSDS